MSHTGMFCRTNQDLNHLHGYLTPFANHSHVVLIQILAGPRCGANWADTRKHYAVAGRVLHDYR